MPSGTSQIALAPPAAGALSAPARADTHAPLQALI